MAESKGGGSGKEGDGKGGDGGDVVEWEKCLEQCLGEDDFMREMLGDLVTESAKHMTGLEEHVPTRNGERIKFHAHSIKGAAANLFCERLRVASMHLERMGMSMMDEKTSAYTDVDELDRLWDGLQEEMRQLKSTLRAEGIIDS